MEPSLWECSTSHHLRPFHCLYQTLISSTLVSSYILFTLGKTMLPSKAPYLRLCGLRPWTWKPALSLSPTWAGMERRWSLQSSSFSSHSCSGLPWGYHLQRQIQPRLRGAIFCTYFRGSLSYIAKRSLLQWCSRG